MKAFIRKKYILVWTLFMLLCACKDVNTTSSIPTRSVYINQNINLYATALRAIGGYKTYTSLSTAQGVYAIGYSGVLVFYGYDENYYAFDLCCPYEAKKAIKVTPNDEGQAVCDSCGSVFNIGYGTGSVESGPATEGLKKYKVSTSYTTSGSYIYVTN